MTHYETASMRVGAAVDQRAKRHSCRLFCIGTQAGKAFSIAALDSLQQVYGDERAGVSSEIDRRARRARGRLLAIGSKLFLVASDLLRIRLRERRQRRRQPGELGPKFGRRNFRDIGGRSPRIIARLSLHEFGRCLRIVQPRDHHGPAPSVLRIVWDDDER